MDPTVIAILCIVLAVLFIMGGSPVFLALGLSGMLGIVLCSGIKGLSVLQTTVFGTVANFTLVAAPLFILMGDIIFRSGIGSDLYSALSYLFRRVPGGLAIGTIIAMAIFGAMCGISIAAVASIGVIALPEMLKRGYNPRLAAGAVCAPGALSMMIPPSLLFILYGAVAHQSVAKLFTAGIMPGIMLAGMMCLYIVIAELRNPSSRSREAIVEADKRELFKALKRLWSPVLLIIIVLGSIYLGIATPTESAAIGVVGAYAIAFFVYRSMNWENLKATLSNSARTMTIIVIVFIGAIVFTQFLNIVRFPDMFAQFIVSLKVSPWITMLMIQLMLLVLGCFIDGASMVLVCTPILLPTVLALNWNPIWFGVLMVANIEIAVITPPIGLNLYTLASITKDVDMATILRGTLPYVILELIGLLILILFPQISLWLPGLMH